MSDKKGLVPIVKAEIGFALQAEIAQEEEVEYVSKILNRLKEDNPCVANFISQLALGSSDPLTSTYMGVVVYRLIESQAEATKLDGIFE